MNVLTLKNVSKTFGDFYAVNDLSFSIASGTMYGLLGPNGAGKTTTIRMIMDIIVPDQGEIEILGRRNSSFVRDRIGYLPEERGLYRKMRVGELLLFFSQTKGMKKADAREKIDFWLEHLDLSEWKDKKVEELSRGMQQKLQFITTVFHEPELIILDEPFTGLDPVNVNLLKEIMLELQKNGVTVILSTHLMDQVEKLCNSICLLHQGKKVLEGPLAHIKKQVGRNSIALAYEGTARFLRDARLINRFDNYGNYVEVHPAEGVDPQEILHRAVQEVTVSRFEIVEPSLNEIFIQTVQR
ncbi:MAG: ATP-binding cassette domain-containing protein [Gemmatimonadota bacterium]|nr:MAG: ATP-binding cassette domain-containing protein [Gemmatimonadota bacterium]